MAIARFISGDGTPHIVNDDSAAFKIMSKDGSFTPVDEDGNEIDRGSVTYTEAEAIAHNGGVDVTSSETDAGTAGGSEGETDVPKLSRPEIVAKAKALGLKASGKNEELLAAIAEAEKGAEA